jgi:uncharacterized protein (DUF58 family)
MRGAARPTTGEASDLLPPEVLERLGSLDLVAKTIVRGFISGAHRSPYLGSGEDFSRHRAYQQGDDVRRLDWRLFARTDRLYVRLFQEDSNLQGFLVIDASESMGFVGDGAVSKLRYSQFVAAALAHVMLRAGDAPGLASFGADTAFHLPPRNRPGHLHDLLVGLERIEARGAGAPSQALDEVGDALRRRGRVVLISDCLFADDGEEFLAAVARLRARGDEVIVIRVASRLELGEVEGHAARYFDPEVPDRVVDAVPGKDPGFRGRVAEYYDRLQRGLEEQGAEYVPLTTDMPLVTALGGWLMARARREARTS